MRRSSFRAPKVVLVFNSTRKLIAIIRSLHTASEIMFGNLQSMSCCCTGKYSQSCGYYFRHLDPRVLIEIDDLDSLTVDEYDRICGKERKYYSLRTMSRKWRNAEKLRKAKKREQHRKALAWLKEFKAGRKNKG